MKIVAKPTSLNLLKTGTEILMDKPGLGGIYCGNTRLQELFIQIHDKTIKQNMTQNKETLLLYQKKKFMNRRSFRRELAFCFETIYDQD